DYYCYSTDTSAYHVF
nr:immunoglobulin light chain junction region [Macaca mulatta]MOV73531.1 immunoglobulin light chain junction region [Macaca mulatta]MOV73570.1 immunoglobulin light chain junction region [Macaca mulatta]MOV73782.1 immunoglobulin light chain junction region [Macaca mulatta]